MTSTTLTLRSSAVPPLSYTTKLTDVLSELGITAPIHAEYWYVVKIDAPIDSMQQSLLKRLLNHDGEGSDVTALSSSKFVISPRISPSADGRNLTEIARSCGLESVKSIEGITVIDLKSDTALSADQYNDIAIRFHNPSTQQCFSTINAAEEWIHSIEGSQQQFPLSQSTDLSEVNILNAGKTALENMSSQSQLKFSAEQIDSLYKYFTEIKRNPNHLELKILALADLSLLNLNDIQFMVDGDLQTSSVHALVQETQKANPSLPKTAIIASPCSAYITGINTGSLSEAALTPNTAAECQEKHTFNKTAATLQTTIDNAVAEATFNHLVGTPTLAGYVRSVEQIHGGKKWGYQQPISLSKCLNVISSPTHTDNLTAEEESIAAGTILIHLGNLAVNTPLTPQLPLINDDPELACRVQCVIQACARLPQINPIRAHFPIVRSGLINTLMQLIQVGQCGVEILLNHLNTILTHLPILLSSPNLNRGFYILAVLPENLSLFEKVAQRECCPYQIIGKTTATQCFKVTDAAFANPLVEIDLALLLKSLPSVRQVKTHNPPTRLFDSSEYPLKEALYQVLKFPSVADKTALINGQDRSVGGLTACDSMVGRWQIPVADVAVSYLDFNRQTGKAIAIGERTPLALLNAPASGRVAVGEAITNIAAAQIKDLKDIRLCANWFAAIDQPEAAANLLQSIKTISRDVCQPLGIQLDIESRPSSRIESDQETSQSPVTAPLSLIISAQAIVSDVRATLSPVLVTDQGDTDLILIDLSNGRCRLGGSVLAQIYNQLGQYTPDLEEIQALQTFFEVIQSLNREQLLLAYHDRSDGGLITTLAEMMFASHMGITIHIDEMCYERRRREREHNEGPGISDPRDLHGRAMGVLFNEELGAVIQVKRHDTARVMQTLLDSGLRSEIYVLGSPNKTDCLQIKQSEKNVLNEPRVLLHQAWSTMSYQVQELRDKQARADEWYQAILNKKDTGLYTALTFNPQEEIAAPFINTHQPPKVAILRAPGTTGYIEMAAAFEQAHFITTDVHMSDLMNGRANLSDFQAFVACGGGASYGGVLAAGEGWAKSILYNAKLYDMFSAFFGRPDTFALGVGNGGQMMSYLSALIPGANSWPRFTSNRSAQFESRLVIVEIMNSPSIFFTNMGNSHLPVIISHQQGYTNYAHEKLDPMCIAMRYIDCDGKSTESYPYNPDGSTAGISGMTTSDGRFTIIMPHPERSLNLLQRNWGYTQTENSPWLNMFNNARRYMG